MKNDLYIDGVRYLTAREAGDVLGYAPDYISRLCREGKLRGRRSGKSWIVEADSLVPFLKAHEAKKQAWHQDLSRELKSVSEEPEIQAIPAVAPAVHEAVEPWPRVHVAPRSLHILRHSEKMRAQAAAARTRKIAIGSGTAILGALLFLSTNSLAMQHALSAVARVMPQSAQVAAVSLFAPLDTVARATYSTINAFTCSLTSWCGNVQVTPPVVFVRSPSAPSTVAVVQPTPVAPVQNITNNITNYIQPTVGGSVLASGVSEQLLNSRLNAMENYLTGRIDLVAYEGGRQTEDLAEDLANGVGGGGFDDIDITNSTVSGSSWSGGSISGASITSSSFTGEATTSNLYVEGSFGFGTSTGLLTATSGAVSTLANGSNGQVLKMVGGSLAWGTDNSGGGGGGSSFFSSTTDDLAIYPADTTDVVIIGNSATTSVGHILEVAGSSLFRGAMMGYGNVTAPRFTATSTTASVFPYASTTGLSATTLCLSTDCRTSWPTDGFSTTSADYWQTQRNFFSTTSADYYKSVNNFFSTTSSDYWKTVNNFFSTSSASYFLSQNQGAAFSTTSANYWETQQTPRNADDLTNNSIEDLNDVAAMTENYGDLLFWNGSSWADIATSSLGLVTSGDLSAYLTLASWYSTTTADLAEGGSNLYYQDARVQTYLDTIAKGYFFSTTSADAWKDQRNFFSTTSASYFASVGLAFSTTSNDAWKDQRNFFSTTSSDYWKTVNNFFSTTSADFWKTANDFFSTTSAQYFAHSSTTIPKTYTTNTFTNLQTFTNASSTLFSSSYASSTIANIGTLNLGAALTVPNGGTGSTTLTGLLKGNGTGAIQTAIPGTDYLVSTAGDWTGTFDGQEGSYYLANSFSTTSASYFSSIGLAFSTTSADAWKDQRNFFSTTSSDYWKTQNNFFSTTSTDYWKTVNNFFSTTSAIHFVDASSTIPKTYSANTFFALQTFSNASTTLLSASYASTTNLFGAGLATCQSNNVLTWNNGVFGCEADDVGSTFAYPFSLAGNATSTLTQFNGGLTAFASSTIGNGTASGGLTISGNSTTTGIAYFAGNVGIGTSSPLSLLQIGNFTSKATTTFASPNSLTYGSSIEFVEVDARSGFELLHDTQNNRLHLNSGTNGSFATPVISFDRVTGNVGIGTTTPGSLADLTIGSSGGSIYLDGGVGRYVKMETGNSNGTLNFDAATDNNSSTLGVYVFNSFSYTDGGPHNNRPLFDVQNAASSKFLISNGGNVGVGTSSPFGKFAISLNNGQSYRNNNAFIIASSTASATTTLFSVSNTGAASTTQLFGAGLATCQSNNVLTWNNGSFGCEADDVGSTFAYPFGLSGNATSTLTQFNGGLTAYASSTIGNGTASGGLTISGNSTTTGNAYIAGNVGIGTVSPSATLHIASTSAGALTDSLLLTNSSATAGTETGIFFAPSSAAGTSRGARISAIQEDGLNSIGLKFYTGAAASITEKLRLTSTGNLGIGTSTPSSGLDIYQKGIAITAQGSVTSPVLLLRNNAGADRMSITYDNTNIGLDINNRSAASLFHISEVSGNVGIGTTTPTWLLNPSSATTPQLSLSAGAGLAQWAFRNAGGDLFFSTTTVAGTATTSTAALSVSGSGFGTTTIRGLNIIGQATSTSNVGINLSAGCYAINNTCISGGGASLTGTLGQTAYFSGTNTAVGTSTLFIHSNSSVGIGTTTPIGALSIYGDTLFNGSNRYANFGTTTGALGYGFRDNAGTLEFKNQNGTWQGVTTATTGPSFHVTKGGSNQTVTANVESLLTWSTESFDTNNNFASDRFTPTVPGKYLITLNVYCVDASGTGYCNPEIKKNGTLYASSQGAASASASAVTTVTTIVDFNGTTDYVEAYIVPSNTTISGLTAYTFFTGTMIAPVNGNNAAGWANNGTASFLLDNADLVGIGTTTPWSKLALNGDLFIEGSNRYINFGTTATGTNGYGIRDNAGNLEFKNSGGSWTGFGTGSGGSGGGQLLATYATSTVGTTTVNFNGSAGSNPSFSAGALTLPSNTSYIVVEVWGGGGGGGGSGVSPATGGTGGMSCLSSNATACSSPLVSATGGTGSTGGTGGARSVLGTSGAGVTGDVLMSGSDGGSANDDVANGHDGGTGGSAPRGGGGGKGGVNGGGVGSNGAAFGGGAGGGGGTNSAVYGAAGAGGGGYAQKLISNVSGTYTFTVGAGGAAGVGGSTGASTGGAGGTGGVVISVYTTGISQGAIGSGAAGFLPYYTDNTASTSLSATSTLFLSTSGRFGIGSTTPFAKLSIDTRGATATPLAIRTGAYAGNYAATSSGIFMYDAAGNETMRIFASDPDNINNHNSANLFIGKEAGASNPTANNNTAGYFNTGIGFQSLTANTSGQGNTALGYESLLSNTTGYQQVAVGISALRSNTQGWGNVALGTHALYNNTTGEANAASGHWASYRNTTGSYNAAFGTYALYYNQSATNTVAVGFCAGCGTANYSNQGGTYLGYQSGLNAATGSDYNTLLGFQSGFNVTSGYGNVGLGASSTANITTGFGNIGIGNNTHFPSATGNRQLNIGGLIFGTLPATSTSLALNPTGSIGIGTTSPLARLSVAMASTTPSFVIGTAGSSTPAFFVDSANGNGNVGIGRSNPAYTLDVNGHINSDLNGAAGAYRIMGGRSLYGDGVFTYVGNLDASRTLNLVAGQNTAATILANGNFGIGTTTPQWLLNPSSATAPQLSLSAGAGIAQWAQRNAGGNLYFSTTTVAGTATSSGPAALTVLGSSGNVGIGTANPIRKLTVVGGSILVDTTQGYQAVDTGSAVQNLALIDSGNNAIYAPAITTGNAYYGLNSISNTTGNLFLQTAGQNRVTISPNGTVSMDGNLGLGTSTPFAQLSILATSTNGLGSPRTLFAIASTTGGVSTTTLFSVSNTGSTTASNGFNITAGCYAVSGTCLSTGGSSFAYPFPAGATTSPLMLLASTTIGNGSAAGGLTISGNSTTTGNAYVAGSIIAAGSPQGSPTIQGIHLGSAANFAEQEMFGTAGVLIDFSGTSGRDLDFRQIFTPSTNDLQFQSSTTVSILALKGNGLVGIGTTTPNAKLTVYGDTLFNGTDRYANFGTTTGALGYGFRDNAGVMEFKNANGTWQGVTTATTGPSFHVHKNGTDQTVSAGVAALITWNTETFDTNNNFDLSTERFAPTVPGKYLITLSVTCLNNANTYCAANILKNGATYALQQESAGGAGSGNAITSTIVDMNGTTDYVEGYGVSGVTTIYGQADYTYFTGTMIAPVNGNNAAGWANDGTQSFLLNSSDRVGIGTSTPWSKLALNGDLFVEGSNRYINFGTTATGTNGYGIRDNAGNLEFKNSGGSWTGFGTGSGGSGGGQLLATYSTSTVGTTTVNFNGSAGSAPSFSAGALTLPSNTGYIVVETWGAGGGASGGGENGTPGGGSGGGMTCFSANATACSSPLLSATGGGGAPAAVPGVGGTGIGGDINMTGGGGGGFIEVTVSGVVSYLSGGVGGSAPRGGGGGTGTYSSAAGAGAAFGGGGAGGGVNGGGNGSFNGQGGGGGGYAQKIINNPSGSYTFAVGAGGAGGTAGTNGFAGAAGGPGGIVISVYTTGISQGAIGGGAAGFLPYYTSNVASTSLSATSSIFLATNGNFGIGTTTPLHKLSITDTIAPQLSLSAGAGIVQWTQRNAGGNLYFATTTVAGTATTSLSALSITGSSGNVGIGTNAATERLQIFNPSVTRVLIGDAARTLQSGVDGDVGAHYGLRGGNGISFTDAGDLIPISIASNGATTFPDNNSGLGRSTIRWGSLWVNGLSVTGGNVGVGTTTPQWGLNAYAAAGPQLSLSNGAGIAQWTQRNAGGNLYFATTTVAGTATTTTSAFTIMGATGNVGIGTSSPGTLFSIGSIANFQNGTSTFYENLNVQGQLKVGTGSIYLNGAGTSTFSHGIQTPTINITNTTATSTFASGINLTGGCIAVSGVCISGGSGSAAGGELLGVYSTSTVGTTTVNFNGAVNSAPSFSGATLTLPSNASYVVVETWGAGAGGQGGASGGAGSAGGNSCFGTNSIACSGPLLQASGGGTGTNSGTGGLGGSGTGGDVNMTGEPGGFAAYLFNVTGYGGGANGGSAPGGGNGGQGVYAGAAGNGGAFGGGGGGGGAVNTIVAANYVGGAGGGAGGYAKKVITNLASTYYLTVGAGGTGGTAGSTGGTGYAGGAGGAGGVVISVYTDVEANTANTSTILSNVVKYTSGSGTYTPPSDISYIIVKMVGGGGGGGGTNNATPGTAGASTTFSTFTAGGGSGGVTGIGGAGGTSTGGTINIDGARGAAAGYSHSGDMIGEGGSGGSSLFGGGGGGGWNTTVGSNAVANTGSGGGGGGASASASNAGASGGGAGGYVEALISSPTSYSYTVGTGGTGASNGGGGAAGGNGAAGVIYIYEYTTTGLTVGSVSSGTQGQFAFYNAAGQDLSATSSLFLTQSGRLGVGTTSPGYLLSVGGDVNIAEGSCYRVNGVCIGYIVKLSAIRTGTSTTNWSKPSNLSYAIVELWGGGGGGGDGDSTGDGAGGGGGGGYMMKNFTATALSATTSVRVTVGAGGIVNTDATGGTGGTSNFGGMASSTGGAGGQRVNGGDALGGAGGTGLGGDVYMIGESGGSDVNSDTSTGNGGAAPRGGGGGGGGSTGTEGADYGGGGGGGATTGGAGGEGGYVIYEYATSSPNAAGNDYAEMFPVSNPGINAGDVVAIDTGVPVSMKLATLGDKALAGVISTDPGQTLGDINAPGMRPVALAGRVPVKVLADESFELGDRVAASQVPGVGRKAGPFDNSVGIVIGPKTQLEDGTYTVMVFLDLHKGFDINAIALKLLGDDIFASVASSTASTTAGTLDFVGGMMSAIAKRIDSLASYEMVASAGVASSTATTTEEFATTTASTTPTEPIDQFADLLMQSILSRITNWFAYAHNGITELFAKTIRAENVYADTVNAKELCLEDICVTKTELQQLLLNNGITTPTSESESEQETTPDAAEETPSATSTEPIADPEETSEGAAAPETASDEPETAAEPAGEAPEEAPAETPEAETPPADTEAEEAPAAAQAPTEAPEASPEG